MPRGVLGTSRRLPYGALAIAAAFGLSSALAWPGAAGAMPARAESSTVAFSAESRPLLGRDVVTVPDMPEVAGIEITGLKSGTERLSGSEPGPVAQVAERRASMTATSSSGVTVPPAPIAASQEIRTAMLRTGLLLEHPVATRQISSAFGWRANPTGAGHQIHIGQDYPIACGSPVRASETGRVIVAGWAGHSGQRVTIDHGNRVQTGYSHNSLLLVSVGEFVVQGQVIALSGTTGNSTGCHVHFEVIVNGQWQNPSNYLPMAGGQRRAVLATGPFAVDAGSALRQQSVAGAFGHSSGTSSNRGSAGEERPTRVKHYQADPVQPSAEGNQKKAKMAKPRNQPKKDHSKASPSPRTTQAAPQSNKAPKPPKKLGTERPKAQPTQTPVPAEPSASTAAPTPSTGPVEQPSASASPTASPTESTMPSASPSASESPAPENPTEEVESTQPPPLAEPTLAPEPSPDSGIEPQQEKETGNPDTSDHEEETEPTAGTEKIIGVAQPKIVDMQAEKRQKAPPVAKELAPAKPAAPEKKSAKKPAAEKPKPAAPAKAAAPAAKKVAKAPVAAVPQPQPKPKLQPKPKPKPMPKPPVAAPAVQKAAPTAAKPNPKGAVPAPAEAAAPAKVPKPSAGTAPAAREAKP
ncbi:peptidoglycan DD-metalloendopeptidase family protein [Glutamicibacter sp. FR1]|uniref:peptidoglycan DD-metalloendopeptidase family protein n=1 Tax=Glutamicibacter sp. FR1 TaxID=3393744 RepID=UPI0039B1241D